MQELNFPIILKQYTYEMEIEYINIATKPL